MTKIPVEVIQPLGLIENQFVQVLLSEFELMPFANGYSMRISYNDNTLAIWNREGKRDALKRIKDFEQRAQRLQSKLDSLIMGTVRQRFQYSDTTFPFRWGNAGTLPIVRIEGIDYVLLFYRDISPIGWNIANGGTDDREELEDPRLCMHRELREELIAVDPINGHQLLLEASINEIEDHPDFRLARRCWQKRESNLHFDKTFHNDILSGRKPHSELVALVIDEIDPQDLPRPLRYRQALLCESTGTVDVSVDAALRIFDQQKHVI